MLDVVACGILSTDFTGVDFLGWKSKQKGGLPSASCDCDSDSDDGDNDSEGKLLVELIEDLFKSQYPKSTASFTLNKPYQSIIRSYPNGMKRSN